jgi:hypothetical protein
VPISSFLQPTEDLPDREFHHPCKFWHRKLLGRLIKYRDRAIGKIDENHFLFGVDQPAHLSAVIQTVQDIPDNFGLALVGREDFDCPVGGDRESIFHFAVGITGNPLPGEDGQIWDDRSAPKGTAQFGIGTGDFGGFECAIHRCPKVTLNRTVLSLGHGFLDDLAVNKFAGGFGVRQREEFFDRQWFEWSLNHHNANAGFSLIVASGGRNVDRHIKQCLTFFFWNFNPIDRLHSIFIQLV